jgi:hypothetical protein
VLSLMCMDASYPAPPRTEPGVRHDRTGLSRVVPRQRGAGYGWRIWGQACSRSSGKSSPVHVTGGCGLGRAWGESGERVGEKAVQG